MTMHPIHPDDAGGLTDVWDDAGNVQEPATSAYDVEPFRDPSDFGVGDLWRSGAVFLVMLAVRNVVVLALMAGLLWAMGKH